MDGTADANGSGFRHARYLSSHSATDTAGNKPNGRSYHPGGRSGCTSNRLGDANITHEAGPEYVDAGARWNDSVDGNGTADANGTVNSRPGTYLITYTYTDSSGPAVPVTRTIR